MPSPEDLTIRARTFAQAYAAYISSPKPRTRTAERIENFYRPGMTMFICGREATIGVQLLFFPLSVLSSRSIRADAEG